jgi:hypothetical protein
MNFIDNASGIGFKQRFQQIDDAYFWPHKGIRLIELAKLGGPMRKPYYVNTRFISVVFWVGALLFIGFLIGYNMRTTQSAIDVLNNNGWRLEHPTYNQMVFQR